MRVAVVALQERKSSALWENAIETYVQRMAAYAPFEMRTALDESRFFDSLSRPGRTVPRLILLDSRGRLLSSEELAGWIGRERDAGAQQLLFAIGPADGWSPAARQRADLLLSFGPMTFPHELARVMLMEQIYRAFTILAGHPYHTGHTGRG